MKSPWGFQQPITVKAVVKKEVYGGKVLRIKGLKNKRILSSQITFRHPEIDETEQSNEAKKYTLQLKENTEEKQEIELDEIVDDTTSAFDLIEMNQQVHEYVKIPSITKIRGKSNKRRTHEDEYKTILD